MKSSLEIIGVAWSFYKKQPVLNQIAFWLLFVPVGILDALSGMIDTVAAQNFPIDGRDIQSMTSMEFAITIPIIIGLTYFMAWGHVCTLTVSKKLLSSSAGRTRTSFKAVRDQSKKFIIPVILVGILRGVTTLLWSLLLIVPGVIYSIRTIFFDIIMIEEGKVIYGRETLAKSTDLVKGHGWDIFWRILLISACIFTPAMLIDMSLQHGLTAIDYRLGELATVLSDAVDAYTGMFFVICNVALYAEVKKLSPTK
ncbi:hypothetical protein COU75_04550 [Candidatus Peregrinibacteria bacterium CG10_big_fil_rev_8_21_14_0_10_42_8]|nr:MAG: hypothetical protein COU75_04550 [Candidatus Peregrinibacteria bacterium CG10_big_fil_rev_8_21_14_0_10_42_8]